MFLLSFDQNKKSYCTTDGLTRMENKYFPLFCSFVCLFVCLFAFLLSIFIVILSKARNMKAAVMLYTDMFMDTFFHVFVKI